MYYLDIAEFGLGFRYGTEFFFNVWCFVVLTGVGSLPSFCRRVFFFFWFGLVWFGLVFFTVAGVWCGGMPCSNDPIRLALPSPFTDDARHARHGRRREHPGALRCAVRCGIASLVSLFSPPFFLVLLLLLLLLLLKRDRSGLPENPWHPSNISGVARNRPAGST